MLFINPCMRPPRFALGAGDWQPPGLLLPYGRLQWGVLPILFLAGFIYAPSMGSLQGQQYVPGARLYSVGQAFRQGGLSPHPRHRRESGRSSVSNTDTGAPTPILYTVVLKILRFDIVVVIRKQTDVVFECLLIVSVAEKIVDIVGND